MRSLLTALLVATLAAPALADDRVSVTGSVVDASTGTAIQTKVVIRDASGRVVAAPTNGKGRFSAVGFEPGPIRITVAAIGYAGDSATCSATGGQTVRLDFRASHRAQMTPMAPKCEVEADTVPHYSVQ